MKKTAKKKERSLFRFVLRTALTDILLAGVILVIFALFHHAIPYASAGRRVAASPTRVTAPPAPTATPAPVPTDSELTAEAEPTPTPTPDPRSEWQIRFADHFTDEVIITENSYTSPNVAITIETVETTREDGQLLAYHVADIYIGDIRCFTTAMAPGAETGLAYVSVRSMAASVEGAVLAMDGDYFATHDGTKVIRNGEIYRNSPTALDACALYSDGVLETYRRSDYTDYDLEALLEAGVVQFWGFGPVLLDENGEAYTEFNTTLSLRNQHPRAAIGYYEPGHYCFVVVDGRQEWYSMGLTIPQLAELMASLGCRAAFNLDGGASAMMSFNDEIITSPCYGERLISDILCIRDLPAEGGEAEEEIPEEPAGEEDMP